MYSNLISQLKEQNALEKLPQVLEEVPKVRKELGYPPLVTPTSQIVGTQAVLNVITGSRYKIIPKEVKDYVKGLYGRPPAPIDPEIQRLAIGDEIPITQRPGDTIPPGLESARKGSGQERPEDVLSYALFPQVAAKFFEIRDDPDWMDKAMIAVAAIALFQERKDKKSHAVEVGPEGKHSAWRVAARTDQMAARYRGGFT
jgi:oxaloacetate decarboxylase alpha subunit